MKVFICEDSFDAILSAIYDAWVESTKVGYVNVTVIREKDLQRNLFDEYIETVCDPCKVEKVTNSIYKKISSTAYLWIYRASLSVDADAPDAIFRFMIVGFKNGYKTTSMLGDTAVMKMMEISRRVGNESAFFREILRFNSVDGNVYVSHFEPKSNVIMYVTNHFCDRMPSENFIIIDDTRKLAAIHPRDEEPYYRNLTDEEFERLSATETYEDEFTSMWRVFFETIAIKERENRRCQLNHFPEWKRKHATEFL